MTEIEKMFENAGVEYRLENFVGLCPTGYKIICYENEPDKVKEVVKDFTAEKQLELIKWLMVNNKDYQYDIEDNKYWFIVDDYRETKYREFNEALAELINLYWQDLTDQEKEEIRKILNA